ncbi:hypothetical protein R1479_02253 [Ralstonia mannitolilytica]|nr:hypothetical protein R1479_02253 [Ralstonia mannitolilytica]
MPEREHAWPHPALQAPSAAPAWRPRKPLAAAFAVAVAGVLAWLSLPQWIAYVPHWPERLPAIVQAWLAAQQPEPDWTALPLGPMLREAERNGELVVAVRAYARPAPAGVATPIEPDNFDADLARSLAEHLQLRLRLVSVPAAGRLPGDAKVDVVIAGAGAAPAQWQPVPTAYTGGYRPSITIASPGATLKEANSRLSLVDTASASIDLARVTLRQPAGSVISDTVVFSVAQKAQVP